MKVKTSHVQASSQGITSFSTGIVEMNDCTVRSLANASGISYEEAHALLKKHGRKDRRGAFISTMKRAYEEAGFAAVSVHGTTRAARSASRVMQIEASEGITLQRLLPYLSKGSYIVNITRHALAVVDGKVIDTFDSPAGTRVVAVFKKVK